MHWLVKTNLNEFEVWTDATHSMMVKKCEYYGAKPFWQEVEKFETELESNSLDLVSNSTIPLGNEDETLLGQYVL